MKKINLIVFTVFVAGCASINNEVGVKGLEPIKSSVSSNLVYFNDYQPQKNRGRAPASQIKQTVPELSNRQIYFLSFYRQYLKLEQSLGMEAKTDNCPSFHQVVIEYKKELEAPFDGSVEGHDYRSVEANMSNLGFYPVLALQSGNNDPLWRNMAASDWKDSNGMLKTALVTHHEDMQTELKQLCDSGVSAGYYVYENLVTYFKEYKEFHYSKEGLKALLKVPTLANMLMLDNLSSTSYYLSQENHFDTWLLQRANTQWFRQYRDHLNQRRGQLIEAKLKTGMR